MKILVIGSAGFTGQFLVKKLVEKKHEAVGLDIPWTRKHTQAVHLLCW